MLPNDAKVHFNVLDYVEREVRGEVVAGKGWKGAPAADTRAAVLKIEFGLGAAKGMHEIDMMEAFTSWQEVVSESTGASSVRGRGRWAQIQRTSNTQDDQRLPASNSNSGSCDFSTLSNRTRTVHCT